MKRAALVLATLALLLGGVGQARADYIANVTVDTTNLTKNLGQAPFQVRFVLTDLSGDRNNFNNNTATISNFNLHGGSLTFGTIRTDGSPTGNLSSTLILKDNLRELFQQEFTPGSTTPSSLSFTLDLTTNVTGTETTFPDELEIDVTQVLASGGEHFLSGLIIDITGPQPAVTPAGGALGNGVSVPEPVVTAVPEPSTLTLLSLGSLSLLGYGWRRRKQPAA
jgi:hypothetical protein